MSKVAAVIKAHAHNGVARLKQSKINGSVSLRARMGLNICILRAEKLARSFDCNVFNYINILATAVITLAGKSLGIFIREHAAHSRHNLRRNKVFGGDELDIFSLAL